MGSLMAIFILREKKKRNTLPEFLIFALIQLNFYYAKEFLRKSFRRKSAPKTRYRI